MADAPSGGGGGILEHIGGMISTGFSHIPGIIMFILRAALFVLLSIIVVPAMLIMLTLHKPWEGMLEGIMVKK